jgi:hypothetical protein
VKKVPGREAWGQKAWAWLWVLVDCSDGWDGNGLSGRGFWGPDGREVVVGIGLVGILGNFGVAVMLGAEGRVCGRKWALSWSLSE